MKDKDIKLDPNGLRSALFMHYYATQEGGTDAYAPF